MEIQARFALTSVAGAIAAALYPSLQAVAQDYEDRGAVLEEIIVTATKREMSVQDIPATIQAITEESLKSMGAKSMEDYARFIPSVNVVNLTNGSSTIIFRGAINSASFIAQSTSSVYLDEMSVTNTGSQPEIRMVDIERVEALSGPQGTLYGSDAQAGTMRIVTNKPVMNEFEVIFDAELRSGSDSEESYRGSLTVNIPLVEDRLALRLVGFSDRDGGFIDNVFGHTPDTLALRNDITYPAEWGSLDNADAVEKDWNDSEVYGGRAALRWEMNDNWAVTLSTAHQVTDSGAFNDYDPFVGDLQTIRFHDEYRYDEFNIHSLVLEADLGFAQLVSATGYYDRDIRQLWDTTVYGHYWTAQYCQDSLYTTVYDPLRPNYYAPNYFANPATGYVIWWPVYCQGQTAESDFFAPSFYPEQQRKFTQEIRLSSEGERFDWIVGLYYEESADAWQSPFAGPTAGGDGSVNLWQGSISQQYYEFYWSRYYGTPTTFPDSEMSWYSQSHTDWTQKAVFGELKWHINEQFTLTLGGRYFERENNQFYLVNHPGALPLAPGALPPGEPDLLADTQRQERLANGGFPVGRSGEEAEFIPKVSLSYSFGEDSMVYGLFTRGKRPGGINRSRGDPFFPAAYEPDTMDNIEIGYRSTFAGGQGRFNATVYNMKWTNYQLEIVDPSSEPCTDPGVDKIPGLCGQPWQPIVANVGEAHISGLNIEIDYAPTDQLILGMNAEFMEAETDTSHDLDGIFGEVDPVTGEFDPEIIGGLRLPTVPKVKWSAWVQYDWPIKLLGAGNQAYARTQWSYTGDSFSTLEPRPVTEANPQFKNEAYTIGDLRVGVQGEAWEVSLFVNNLTDERAQYTHRDFGFDWAAANLAEGRPHIARIYTNRPREYGIRYTKRWGD